jgi:hypothetical protein
MRMLTIALMVFTNLLFGCSMWSSKPKPTELTPSDFTTPGVRADSTDHSDVEGHNQSTGALSTKSAVNDSATKTNTNIKTNVGPEAKAATDSATVSSNSASSEKSATVKDTGLNDDGVDSAGSQGGKEETSDVAVDNREAGAVSRAIVANAMIGQVNGKPLYASTVFAPLKEVFATKGRTTEEVQAFRAFATEKIHQRLYTLLFDPVVLGEAKRNMSKEELQHLQFMLRLNREKLIRQFGRGSEAEADAQIKKLKGKSLDDLIKDIRHGILTRKYLDTHVNPKISVSQRDVERYYRENPNIFNPPPGRTVRYIRTTSDGVARRMDRLLKAGEKSFAEIAKDSGNQHNRLNGGLVDAVQYEGSKTSIFEALNKAVFLVEEGKHSKRITVVQTKDVTYHFWLFVEKIHSAKSKPLSEVQLAIEQGLRRKQREILTTRYIKRLYVEAGFDYEDPKSAFGKMRKALVEIAVSKYANYPS